MSTRPTSRQAEFYESSRLWHDSVEAKLTGLMDGQRWQNFRRCGREKIYRHCRGCKSVQTFTYRCNVKWCPCCGWKIAASRRRILGAWASTITQPKHLVLTQRNFPTLTRAKIVRFKRALARLRRLSIWKKVAGGCYSIETTNEGKGWHLHAHLFINVRWLDMARLSVAWGKQVGQEFGIVKIKDVRAADYLAEITKYVVKFNELASWEPEDIHQLVLAVDRVRMFGAFGDLARRASAIRNKLAAQESHHKVCECGCDDFYWLDETSEVVREICPRRRR